MLQNSFIVALEGNPGAGKTTIKNGLVIDGMQIERIDQILPDNPNSAAELLPADIVASDLLKSSQLRKHRNKLVVMDRYFHSTLAYQYASDHLDGASDYDKLASVYHHLQDLDYLLLPNLTIYIDVPPYLSISRKDRENSDSRWADETFLSYMKEYYDDCADIGHVIDGSQDYSVVHNEIVAIIMKEVDKQY